MSQNLLVDCILNLFFFEISKNVCTGILILILILFARSINSDLKVFYMPLKSGNYVISTLDGKNRVKDNEFIYRSEIFLNLILVNF